MSMPLGPRRSYWGASSDHVCVERITKAEVDRIIDSGEFECYYRQGNDTDFQEYDGCKDNLRLILHDGKTGAKVAGTLTPGFLQGYKTVVMIAPCMEATILLRIQK